MAPLLLSNCWSIQSDAQLSFLKGLLFYFLIIKFKIKTSLPYSAGQTWCVPVSLPSWCSRSGWPACQDLTHSRVCVWDRKWCVCCSCTGELSGGRLWPELRWWTSVGSAAWPACSDGGLQGGLQTQPEDKERDGSAHLDNRPSPDFNRLWILDQGLGLITWTETRKVPASVGWRWSHSCSLAAARF